MATKAELEERLSELEEGLEAILAQISDLLGDGENGDDEVD